MSINPCSANKIALFGLILVFQYVAPLFAMEPGKENSEEKIYVVLSTGEKIELFLGEAKMSKTLETMIDYLAFTSAGLKALEIPFDHLSDDIAAPMVETLKGMKKIKDEKQALTFAGLKNIVAPFATNLDAITMYFMAANYLDLGDEILRTAAAAWVNLLSPIRTVTHKEIADLRKTMEAELSKRIDQDLQPYFRDYFDYLYFKDRHVRQIGSPIETAPIKHICGGGANLFFVEEGSKNIRSFNVEKFPISWNKDIELNSQPSGLLCNGNKLAVFLGGNISIIKFHPEKPEFVKGLQLGMQPPHRALGADGLYFYDGIETLRTFKFDTNQWQRYQTDINPYTRTKYMGILADANKLCWYNCNKIVVIDFAKNEPGRRKEISIKIAVNPDWQSFADDKLFHASNNNIRILDICQSKYRTEDCEIEAEEPLIVGSKNILCVANVSVEGRDILLFVNTPIDKAILNFYDGRVDTGSFLTQNP